MSVTELDLKIIRCLQRNPRATNKSIGSAVGVTEQTIASRIRGLREAGVMRVMAQRDFSSAGYPLLAFAAVLVSGGLITRVANQLAAIEEAFSVVLCPGSPELIVSLAAPNVESLDVVVDRLRAIYGVIAVDLTTANHIRMYRTGSGDLTSGVGPPLPLDRQDPVDEAIISLLVEDGRQSNREIARRISISEGSVRARLKRLNQRSVMKLGVVCEPDRVGYVHSAFIFVNGRTDVVGALLDDMAKEEMVSFAASTSGAHDGMLFCVAETPQAIAECCIDRLRGRAGMNRLVYRPLLRTLKHRYDYVVVGDAAHHPNPEFVLGEVAIS